MGLYGRDLKTKMYYIYTYYNLFDSDITINYNFVLHYETIKSSWMKSSYLV